MTSMAWEDQYKHPLWQKKRLEAMEAAEYCCQRCYDGETTLQVHHKRYVKGRMVWEYEINELSVLCEPCHEKATLENDTLKDILARLHPEGLYDVIAVIAGYCNAVNGPAHIPDMDDIFSRIGILRPVLIGHCAGVITAAMPTDKQIAKFASEVEAINYYDGGMATLEFNAKERTPLGGIDF